MSRRSETCSHLALLIICLLWTSSLDATPRYDELAKTDTEHFPTDAIDARLSVGGGSDEGFVSTGPSVRTAASAPSRPSRLSEADFREMLSKDKNYKPIYSDSPTKRRPQWTPKEEEVTRVNWVISKSRIAYDGIIYPMGEHVPGWTIRELANDQVHQKWVDMSGTKPQTSYLVPTEKEATTGYRQQIEPAGLTSLLQGFFGRKKKDGYIKLSSNSK